MDGWIGVDLDGVLAEYHGFRTDIDIGYFSAMGTL